MSSQTISCNGTFTDTKQFFFFEITPTSQEHSSQTVWREWEIYKHVKFTNNNSNNKNMDDIKLFFFKYEKLKTDISNKNIHPKHRNGIWHKNVSCI